MRTGTCVRATFSPDGRTLASGSENRTVRIWHLDNTLINLACRTAGRNLSQEEWQRYRGDEPYHKTCKNLPIHPSLIDAGDELAKAGDIVGAVAQYRKVLEIEPGLVFDPEAKAKQLAASGAIEKGINLAEQGKIDEALATFSQARQYDPKLEIAAHDWGGLCFYGSLWGQAATVMHACERAVELASDNGGIRAGRGIARALTGNLAGASEDFRAFLEWAPANGMPEILISKPQHWLRELEAGRNPFDAATLEALREGEL